MAKSGSIIVEASSISYETYNQLLQSLLKGSWSFNNNGIVSYMTNETYDWVAGDYKNVDKILSEIKTSIENNFATTLDLVHENYGVGIGLGYIDRDRVVFSLIGELKMIEAIRVIDFTWYLERISDAISVLQFHRIECIFD